MTIFKLVLFWLPPETAHNIIIFLLKIYSKIKSSQPKWISKMTPLSLGGLTLQHPIGLAAGFDKNGKCLFGLQSLGFSFIEVGSVTEFPRNGNPKPRIWRNNKKESIYNSMGVPNDGFDSIIYRIQKAKDNGLKVPIGISLLNSTKNTSLVIILPKANEVCDFITLNISCPNVPGAFLEWSSLQDLLFLIKKYITKPFFIKIPWVNSKSELRTLFEILVNHEVSGIIAVNSKVCRGNLTNSTYGESGRGIIQSSTETMKLLQELKIECNSNISLIASGGLVDLTSIEDRIDIGANAIQLYSGFIFKGPGLIRKAAEQHARRCNFSD